MPKVVSKYTLPPGGNYWLRVEGDQLPEGYFGKGGLSVKPGEVRDLGDIRPDPQK